MSGSITGQTVTAANIVYMLAVANLFPVAQQIQGFSPDAVIETEQANIAETQMGVDGFFAGGYVPVPFKEVISLLAFSPSCAMFDIWYETQKASRDIYYGTASIVYPAINRKWTRQQGVLTRYSPIAPAKKMLEMRTFEITWGMTDGAIL